METTSKLYSLSFGNVRTYLFAFLFVIGNIALPQLCHLVPAGGATLLPIYFFTLIAAYKYGFRTAWASRYAGKVSLAAILMAVLCYQAVGTVFECVLYGDFFLAVQDFRMGIPGMLIQWFGGYALLKAIARI